MLYCILFEKKCEPNKIIPHGMRSVNCHLGLQHLDKYHAYEHSQVNKSVDKILMHCRINSYAPKEGKDPLLPGIFAITL